MHVCLLGPVAPPAGGVQSHMESLRRRLVAEGHRATPVAITRSTAQVQDGAHYPHGPVQLFRLLASLQPDVIHLHVGGDFGSRIAMLTALLAIIPIAPVVLTIHSGGYPTSPRGSRARWWSPEGMAFRRVDAAIAVNRQIAETIQRFGARADRVHVIAPYQKISADQIAKALPPALEAFYRSHDPILVSAGQLEKEYCLDLQIDALSRLREMYPSAGLVIIGSGSLVGELQDRISTASLQNDVCLTGNLAYGATLRAIQEADVLLRTTLFDGDAVSVREALQLRTPVVASSTALRPDGVFLLKSLDVMNVTTAVTDVLRELAQRQSAASLNHDEETDELQRVIDLYLQLISRRNELK